VDIAEFVKARLDEDEATAKAALESEWFAHVTEFASANHYDTFGDLAVDYWQWFPGEADGVHVARHDPARVPREVEAKRAHLSQWMDARAQVVECGRAGDDAGRSRWEAVALALTHVVVSDAAVWSDHPDYRAEWKP
jgi:hypothetical protein